MKPIFTNSVTPTARPIGGQIFVHSVETEEEFDLLGALDGTDDFHGSLAARALQRIGSPDFENEVPPEWAHGADASIWRCRAEEVFRLGEFGACDDEGVRVFGFDPADGAGLSNKKVQVMLQPVCQTGLQSPTPDPREPPPVSHRPGCGWQESAGRISPRTAGATGAELPASHPPSRGSRAG
jgi:hypothetical protein